MIHHCEDIPVTKELLAVVLTIQTARKFYMAESSLAEHFNTSAPCDYFKRCEDLFSKTYAKQAKQAGLSLNLITIEGIVRFEVPAEVLCTEYQQLPNTWIFNPYYGWRQKTQDRFKKNNNRY